MVQRTDRWYQTRYTFEQPVGTSNLTLIFRTHWENHNATIATLGTGLLPVPGLVDSVQRIQCSLTLVVLYSPLLFSTSAAAITKIVIALVMMPEKSLIHDTFMVNSYTGREKKKNIKEVQ